MEEWMLKGGMWGGWDLRDEIRLPLYSTILAAAAVTNRRVRRLTRCARCGTLDHGVICAGEATRSPIGLSGEDRAQARTARLVLAKREHGVAGEQLVDVHAGDAHHRGAAVVALGVELPRLAQEELILRDLR
eukprot:6778096-Prymnesium_polylepis.1